MSLRLPAKRKTRHYAPNHRHSGMFLAVVRVGSPLAEPELDPGLKHSGVTRSGSAPLYAQQSGRAEQRI